MVGRWADIPLRPGSLKPKEFASFYECDFKPTERDNKLRELSQAYVTRCEQYDRIVCTGPVKNGEIIPADGYELGLVNRNARKVIDQIVMENPEYSRIEIINASARLAP